MFLTSDSQWGSIVDPSGRTTYTSWTRLSLLRDIVVGGNPAAELLDATTLDNLQLTSLAADGERLFATGRHAYSIPGNTTTDVSDRLIALDLSGKKVALVYDQSMKTYNARLMGVYQGRLFVNLPGDGILIGKVADAAKPTGLHFARTLGYATHIALSGDNAYVASGYFGSSHIDLAAARSLLMQ